MKFNDLIIYLVENYEPKKLYKFEVKFNGKIYYTRATSEAGAKSKIGARLAKENNLRREYYYKFIQPVLRDGKAKIVEEKCWKGYKQMGMKKKGKRIVPNCVKKKAKKTK